MTTPYDRKILLVNWRGRATPGNSVFDVLTLMRDKMPNVSGIILRTSNGVSWEGHLGDSGPLAITGVTRIREWVEGFAQQGLEVHVWGKPRAKRPEGAFESDDLEKEADKFVRAATVLGVKSLLLDVEHGPNYWQGSKAEVVKLMTLIRQGVGSDYHIGMILDGRENRPFSFWVDPWIPFVDSLHPMVYPILFGGSKTIEQHMDVAVANLAGYGKPIVPMLQAFGEAERRATPEEITRQGAAAWSRGAAGISFYRLGTDRWAGDHAPHMGEPEYAAIAQIARPGDRPAPTYTWQAVLNAAITVSCRTDTDWEPWFDAAGFWRTFDNSLRPSPYSGPPIEDWPMPADLRAQMLELVVLDRAELLRITRQAEAEKAARDAAEAAKKRRERGSIIGIHGAPGNKAPPQHTWPAWMDYLKEMGVKWYKQCDDTGPDSLGPGTIFDWARHLKANDIEPIIRFFPERQFPKSLPDVFFDKMRRYADEGIVWVEIGNEPNLDFEWDKEWLKPDDTGDPRMRYGNPKAVESVAEAWIKDAQKALAAGVKPAFYAFAPTDWKWNSNPIFSSVHYTRAVVQYLADHHRAETVDVFARGGWIAVHVATYGEPLDLDPHKPGDPKVMWDMTLRGYEVVLDAFRDAFGDDLDVTQIPIMSTEGGVFTPKSTSMVNHKRAKNDQDHAQQVVEMFQWLERNGRLQAMCPWILSNGDLIGHGNERFRFDGWIKEVNGQLVPRAVYEAMRQMRFDQEREAEEGWIKLKVPYISQWDETAGDHLSDCGPASMAMILNAVKPQHEHVTVDQLYDRHLPDKLPGEFTKLHEMVQIGEGEDLDVERVAYPDGPDALANLHELVEKGIAFVALVNYAKWDDVAENNFSGGHFVVVTGFDEKHVLVHDPLFSGDRRHKGAYFVWRNQRFLDGWGSGHEIGNPNFTAIVPTQSVGFI